MSKELLQKLERVIDRTTDDKKLKLYKGQLEKEINKSVDSADISLQDEIARISAKFNIGGGEKKTPAKKPTPKKPTAKKPTEKKPKTKTTPEEKAQKKEQVKNATGKTIEECKEILAKYEAMRLKTNKEQKERITELKNEDKIIEGTNVKTAEATTETTAEQVTPKIKKEVEQIVKDAEKEATKKVYTSKIGKKLQGKKPSGKTTKEVKEKIEKKKEEIIEKKVEDMTEDLISATTKFIESVSSEIGKFKKDDRKKFLINLRKEIDVLLRDYGYGGELSAGVQGYEIPWAGGGRPTMFAKGGTINSFTAKGFDDEKFLYNLIEQKNENDGGYNYIIQVESKDRKPSIMAQFYDKQEALDYLETFKNRFPKDKLFAKGGKINNATHKMAKGGDVKFAKYKEELESKYGKNFKNKELSEEEFEKLWELKEAKNKKYSKGGNVSKVDNALKQAEELLLDQKSLERRLREERRLAVETDKPRTNAIDVLKRRIQMNKELAQRMSSWAFSTNDGMNKEKYSKYLNYLSQINPRVKSYAKGGELKPIPKGNKGLPHLPKEVRNKMGYMKEGGEVGENKLDKIVMHYDGRDWELEKYPTYVDNGDSDDWLGQQELSLEEAKRVAFELGGDEAYDYMDEINEAKDISELQDALSDLKYFQRDNTYNSSWWGGVVDFGVLTEDGEGYGEGLVILRMHRGGDPRGNYYDYAVYKLDNYIEEFPPYFARLTYQVTDKDGNTATFDTEDMEGYRLYVVDDEIHGKEEGDYITIDELEEEYGVYPY